MRRARVVPVLALCLAALTGCHVATPLRTPPPAPVLASSHWQPNYLAGRPIASPYARVSIVTDVKRLCPVPPAVVPAAHRMQPVTLARPVAHAHAPDFRWVEGVLEHDKERGRWYVRYDSAPPGAAAGVLELVGVRSLGGLEAGQRVRIEGQRIDRARHEVYPAYRATTIVSVGLAAGK